jgi:hypothetical protein
MTSPKQISLFTEEKSTYLQVDSLANPTQQQESDLAKRMIDISGRKCLEQYGRFNRHGLWARTFSDLLIGTGDWFSTRCRLTWKLKGTKYNRMYFQLYPSTLPTDGTEYGLLPTPTVIQGGAQKVTSMKKDNTYSAGLHDLAYSGLLPTPTAIETPRKPERIQELKEKNLPLMSRELGDNSRQVGILDTMEFYGMLPTPRVKGHGNSHQRIEDGKIDDLTTMARFNMLPTPMASDFKGAYRPESMENKTGKVNREERLVNIYLKTEMEYNSKTSQLSPQFVMEMMGFPTDWTLLPFLNGETNPSKPQEMP